MDGAVAQGPLIDDVRSSDKLPVAPCSTLPAPPRGKLPPGTSQFSLRETELYVQSLGLYIVAPHGISTTTTMAAEKVIILTGASRGIGLAIAHYLLKEKHNKLVVVARTAGPLEELKKQYPGQVEVLVGDLADFAVRWVLAASDLRASSPSCTPLSSVRGVNASSRLFLLPLPKRN